MRRNRIHLGLPLSCALMLWSGAAGAQSPLEIYEQRVRDCMGDRNSGVYETDICVAFRDGVIYARDALQQMPTGDTLTQYNMSPPQPEHLMAGQPNVLTTADKNQLIDDMLRKDDPSSMIVTVDPKSGTVSAAPLQQVPIAPAVPSKGQSPYVQQVR